MDERREKLAWMTLTCMLIEARRDKSISASSSAMEFLKEMQKAANEAKRKAIKGLPANGMFDHVRSAQSRSNAHKGHSVDWPIIAWIREEWEKNGGKDSKRAFAKKYVPLIRERFGVNRKERTISESWLKGY